ncbi:putative periplasmic beta-glucosidase [Gregarina niphandrodes]|uniref:beta-glucosidase n=1 Tax=Gregarina niphandrodes TaxID=110365 RepID=A0A023B2B9_GRENI|nr:putative periplasmic beta-glucosidase [Gregarina niphandrodes]EZG52596.1 putative periplasmic beta-glucosidase [Gregarina niphandrodes]|eukprot:XP_011131882.1 putative periplasmic beta-glucosidase [Gregarina niphandrodes]
MSWYKLHNEYLLPYKAAIEAGAYTTMSSFNLLNGVPMHAYREVHEDIIRGMFGFRGFTVSDYGAIMELSHHNVSDADHPENAAMQGLYAGVDMDMADGYYDKLRKYKDVVLPNGRTVEDVVNLSCKRVLKVKQDIGLFEHGGLALTEDRDKLWSTVWFTDEHLEVSRQAAIKSSVLLVNKDNTLPLTAPADGDDREFLLIGRMADFPDDLMGSWAGLYLDPEMTPRQHTITREIDLRFGCKLADSDDTITDTGCNWQYRKGWNQIYDSTPNDGELDDTDIAANKEVLDLIKADPKRFNTIFMVVGESFVQNGESTARAHLELPLTQAQLVKDVRTAADPATKLVLILNIGRPNIITWEAANVDAILLTWAPGSMAGPAIFDMVFGAAVPSGRLPVSFPRSEGQIPVYHSKRPSGRMMPTGMEDGIYNPLTDKFFSRYLDEKVVPLFPFGFGLSYNQFEISDVSIDKETVTGDGTFTISATVKRSGDHLDLAEGEVVQVYIHQATSTMSPPVKKLKEFQRVEFASKDTSKSIKITMNAADAFGYYNGQLNYTVEEGTYYIYVVHDSSEAGDIKNGIVVKVKN